MTITPITSAEYVSRSVSFEGKKKNKAQNATPPQHSSSAIKAIPVAVLIAMSPLNTTSVASGYSPMSIGQRTELVAQDSQQPLKLVRDPKYGTEKETIQILGYSNDGMPLTIEKCFFKYRVDLGEGIGYLNGKLIAFSNETDDQDRRLIAYQPADNEGKLGDIQLCYLTPLIGYVVAPEFNNPKTNNGAVGYLPLSEFSEFFGEEGVKNAPHISSCITSYREKAL